VKKKSKESKKKVSVVDDGGSDMEASGEESDRSEASGDEQPEASGDDGPGDEAHPADHEVVHDSGDEGAEEGEGDAAMQTQVARTGRKDKTPRVVDSDDDLEQAPLHTPESTVPDRTTAAEQTSPTAGEVRGTFSLNAYCSNTLQSRSSCNATA